MYRLGASAGAVLLGQVPARLRLVAGCRAVATVWSR